MKTPSWDEFRDFLEHDDWEQERATGHDFFEKTLPDGEILRTHASRAARPSSGKSSGPGRRRLDRARRPNLPRRRCRCGSRWPSSARSA